MANRRFRDASSAQSANLSGRDKQGADALLIAFLNPRGVKLKTSNYSLCPFKPARPRKLHFAGKSRILE